MDEKEKHKHEQEILTAEDEEAGKGKKQPLETLNTLEAFPKNVVEDLLIGGTPRLQCAAQYGDTMQFLFALYEATAEAEVPNSGILEQAKSCGDPLLHEAASHGNNEIVKLIAKKLIHLIFHKNGQGDTPLHLAARNGHLSTVKILVDLAKLSVEEDFDFYSFMNEKNFLGHTALHEAFMDGNHEMVEFFIFSAYEEMYKDVLSDLLQQAVKTYDKPYFQLLLFAFPLSSDDPDFQPIKAAYASIIHARTEDEKARSELDILNKEEADEVVANSSRLPRLYEAARKGNTKMFVDALSKVEKEGRSLLLEILTKGGPSGYSLLHLAASCGNDEIVEYIASNFFAQIFHQNCQGDTPLHVAARCGYLGTVKIILRHAKEEGEQFGEDRKDFSLLKARNMHGYAALHEAVLNGNQDIVEFFANLYEDIFDDCTDQDCLLQVAVNTNNKIILGVLHALSRRPSSSSRKHDELRAAYGAIMRGRTDMFIAMLARSPLLVESEDWRGQTPLHWAAHRGDLEAVCFILRKSRKSLFKMDKKGFFPIHVASRQGHVKIIKQFLKHWPEPAILLAKDGENILHVAAAWGRDQVVRYILRTPAMDKLLNQKDRFGNTPLHLAAKNSHPAVLLSLTWDARVQVNLLNKEGFTPHDVFWESNETDLEEGPVMRHTLSSSALSSAGCRSVRELEEGKVKVYNSMRKRPRRIGWMKNQVGALLTIGTLVATVTFTAGFTVPGGYNSSDDIPDKGLAALLNEHMFQLFVISNNIAFYLSIVTIISCFYTIEGDLVLAGKAFVWAQSLFGVALVMMSVAFMAAIYLGVSKLSWLAFLTVIMGTLFIIILVLDSMTNFIPLHWKQCVMRYISYYISRAMILLFLKDDSELHDSSIDPPILNDSAV